MKCINPQCQREIGDMMFCPYCGTKQAKPKVFCAYCGAEMEEDALFCDNCGHKSFLAQQEEEKRLIEDLKRNWAPIDDPDLLYKLDANSVSLTVKLANPSTGRTVIEIPSVIRLAGNALKVEALAEGAFAGCKALMRVVLPDDLEAIPARAFKDCTSLKSIELPESIVDIEEEAFAGSGLTSITIPEAVLDLGHEAFSGCQQLMNVIVEGDSVGIQNTTFDFTPFLKTLEYKSLINSKTLIKKMPAIPRLESIEKENVYATRDYPYLLFVFAPKKNTFTVMMKPGSRLPSVLTIPRRVSIGNFGYPVINVAGFDSSKTLEKLVIPGPGEKINVCKKAFAGCTSLESVYIESRETTVYSGAFEGCTNLKDVEFKYGEQPHLSVTAFSGCSALPMMKRLKLVKFHDVKVDLSSLKLDLPSFLKK